jgi:hypothetical protein
MLLRRWGRVPARRGAGSVVRSVAGRAACVPAPGHRAKSRRSFRGRFSGEQYALVEAVGSLPVRRELPPARSSPSAGGSAQSGGEHRAGRCGTGAGDQPDPHRDGVPVAVSRKREGEGRAVPGDATAEDQRVYRAALVRRRAAPLVRAYLGRR